MLQINFLIEIESLKKSYEIYAIINGTKFLKNLKFQYFCVVLVEKFQIPKPMELESDIKTGGPSFK